MNKKILFIVITFLIVSAFLINGCLKDSVSPVQNLNIEGGALALNYFEQQGDIINSDSLSIFVQVDEVYQNNNYLVVDLRSNDDFKKGHISGAVNVHNDSLLQYLNTIKTNNYPKVILVSATGQASSYYTCLLRLYGFNNVYSLLFGMSLWNSAFADTMIHNTGFLPLFSSFDNNIYSPPPLSQLPSIPINASDIQSGIQTRIASLIKTGFVNNTTYVTIIDPNLLSFNYENISDFYIVCYGIDNFYIMGKLGTTGSGHFPGAVQYKPGISLRSNFYLQTLPANKKIVVYSYSGDISAFVVAYLRTLGYDAKSLLFGANLFMNPVLTYNLNLYSPFAFQTSNIRNYPFDADTSSH